MYRFNSGTGADIQKTERTNIMLTFEKVLEVFQDYLTKDITSAEIGRKMALDETEPCFCITFLLAPIFFLSLQAEVIVCTKLSPPHAEIPFWSGIPNWETGLTPGCAKRRRIWQTLCWMGWPAIWSTRSPGAAGSVRRKIGNKSRCSVRL